jgi:hypothetical protein
MVRADVDVAVFSTNTLGVMNLIMLVHSQGMNAENVQQLLQYSPPTHVENDLFDDLLHKRNQHLLGEVRARLLESDTLVVPWGVAHMPEIAREIQKLGFRLEESQEYEVIRFHGKGKNRKRASE